MQNFSHGLAILLLTRTLGLVHKTMLSLFTIVFDLTYLVICYVLETSPLCNISTSKLVVVTGTTLASEENRAHRGASLTARTWPS